MSKKKLKICLVGFGRFGKKYFKNLKKSSYFTLKFILRKRLKNTSKGIEIYNDLKKAKKIKIDGIIIASPPKTHFNICKFFIKKKTPIILEKPAASNFKQLKKLISMKKNNQPLLVNHSDLHNPLFQKIQHYKKKIGKIKFIKINFGKFDYQYTIKRNLLPSIDWFPHIFATLTIFFNNKYEFKVKENNLKINKNSYFQKVKIDLLDKKKNIFGEVIFSNFKKNRLIDIYGTNGHLRYDSYNISNNFVKVRNKIYKFDKLKLNSPMENLLYKFYFCIVKKKNVNDLKIVFKYQKILDQINKIMMSQKIKNLK